MASLTRRHQTLSLLFFIFSISAFSQALTPANDECSNAVTLCAGVVDSSSNIGANNTPATDTVCFFVDATVWFSFTTNKSGGNVSVVISDIKNCNGNNLLQAFLISAERPCDRSTYEKIDCEPNGSNSLITLNGNLSPNKKYWVMVDGRGSPPPVAECEFNITVSGPGVEDDCNAGPDQYLISGETTTIEADVIPGSTVLWTPAVAINDPTAIKADVSPSGTITYTLTAMQNGCPCTDQVTIYVKPKIVPTNTITPNGDGANDVWKVVNLELYPEATVDIFTRWGEKVFSSKGYKTGEEWDGTNHGLSLPAGTYFYVITLGIESETVPTEHGGFITLIR